MLNNKNIKLLINTDFKDICDMRDNRLYLFGSEFGGKVFYTGVIDELFYYKFVELPYRSIDRKFETVEKDYYQKAAAVNYSNQYNFTRITEFKHVHPVESLKTTILKEHPKECIKGEDTPYYPIFTDENRQKHDRYLLFYEQFKNLIPVGRLAEYRYHDMDDIVEKDLKVFEESILK